MLSEFARVGLDGRTVLRAVTDGYIHLAAHRLALRRDPRGYVAEARRDRRGPWDPNEGLAVEEALDAPSIGPARASVKNE